MIKVYVRDEEGASEGLFGEFAPAEIPCISELFKRWPTIIESGDIQEFLCDRFAIRDGDTVFEIIVGG